MVRYGNVFSRHFTQLFNFTVAMETISQRKKQKNTKATFHNTANYHYFAQHRARAQTSLQAAPTTVCTHTHDQGKSAAL
jgi:hypothetical protein